MPHPSQTSLPVSLPHHTYKVTLAYDGAAFHGVSPSVGVRTVGGALAAAIAAGVGEPPRAMAWAARTDSGVHARANVFSFKLDTRPEPGFLWEALLPHLGPGVHVRDVAVVPQSFHARASARSKVYRYRMVEGTPPLGWAPFVWTVGAALDVTRMRALAQALPGTRDWSAMRHARCEANPVKALGRITIRSRPLATGRLWILDVEGTGFVRQQVRRLVSTLALTGAGWFTVDGVMDALERRDRTGTGLPAPARGLTLWRVDY